MLRVDIRGYTLTTSSGPSRAFRWDVGRDKSLVYLFSEQDIDESLIYPQYYTHFSYNLSLCYNTAAR
jgi:hypothetical protein